MMVDPFAWEPWPGALVLAACSFVTDRRVVEQDPHCIHVWPGGAPTIEVCPTQGAGFSNLFGFPVRSRGNPLAIDPSDVPIQFARRLTGRNRTHQSNRTLGVMLAFVAGAINAGGFLAVQQYTSHMTGIVSSMADNLALGNMTPVLVGMGALLSFMLGAACSAVMVHYARRKNMHSEFALPLLLEAALLLVFGLLGGRLMGVAGLFVPVTVMLLCFMMGLQNAVISKLSHAEIRTTHVTGLVTDIGIEVGKLLYWNRHPTPGVPTVLANRQRLRILLLLVVAFFVGGVIGALGFQSLGYRSTVPLAFLLVLMAAIPALDDLRELSRRFRIPR